MKKRLLFGFLSLLLLAWRGNDPTRDEASHLGGATSSQDSSIKPDNTADTTQSESPPHEEVLGPCELTAELSTSGTKNKSASGESNSSTAKAVSDEDHHTADTPLDNVDIPTEDELYDDVRLSLEPDKDYIQARLNPEGLNILFNELIAKLWTKTLHPFEALERDYVTSHNLDDWSHTFALVEEKKIFETDTKCVIASVLISDTRLSLPLNDNKSPVSFIEDKNRIKFSYKDSEAYFFSRITLATRVENRMDDSYLSNNWFFDNLNNIGLWVLESLDGFVTEITFKDLDFDLNGLLGVNSQHKLKISDADYDLRIGSSTIEIASDFDSMELLYAAQTIGGAVLGIWNTFSATGAHYDGNGYSISCDENNVEDCLGEIVSQLLTQGVDNEASALSQVINDAIAVPISLSEKVTLSFKGLKQYSETVEDAGLKFILSLGALATPSDKTISTYWETQVQPLSEDVAGCASELIEPDFTTAEYNDEASDYLLDSTFPLHLLKNIFYQMSRQGIFCLSYSQTSGSITGSVALRPRGTLDVSDSDTGMIAVEIPVTLDLKYTVSSKTQSLSLPGRIKLKLALVENNDGLGVEMNLTDANIEAADMGSLPNQVSGWTNTLGRTLKQQLGNITLPLTFPLFEGVGCLQVKNLDVYPNTLRSSLNFYAEDHENCQ